MEGMGLQAEGLPSLRISFKVAKELECVYKTKEKKMKTLKILDRGDY